MAKSLARGNEGFKGRLLTKFKGFGSKLSEIPATSYTQFIGLSLILAIAATLRLLPLRWGAFLSEFDPYQQYRMAEYVVNNGFGAWFDWYDNMSWYPWGRYIPTTNYPGVAFTAALMYLLLQDLGIPISLYQLCVIFPVIMGTATCFAIYLLGREWGRGVALFSALLLAFSTSHIARTSLGFFDDETIGILTMVLFFTFYLKAISPNKSARACFLYSILAGLSLAYLSASWGAFRYPLSIIALFTFVLILIKRYSRRLLAAFSVTYGVFFAIAFQLPNLGYAVLTEWPTLAIALIFLLLIGSEAFVKVGSRRGRAMVVSMLIAVIVVGGLILLNRGLISSPAGKFLAILNPPARLEMPLVESVAEHRPATWASFFYEFGALLFLGALGFLFSLQKLRNSDIFLVLFGLSSVYFAGSLVRLTLILAPALCLLSSIAVVELAKPSIDILREKVIFPKKKVKFIPRVGREFGAGILLILLLVLMPTLYYAVESAYAPTTIAVSSLPIAPSEEEATRYQDWLQALMWMKDNLPEDAVVFSWWDYGYWITAIADKRSMADNGTLNSTQIALIARTFLSNETEAIPTLRAYNVTHIAIFVTWTRGEGGKIQYYGYGEDNKWYWMARISNGSSYDGKTIYFHRRSRERETIYDRILVSNGQIISNETIADGNGLNENSVLGKLIIMGITPGRAKSDYFRNVYSSQPNRFVFVYEVNYPEPSEITCSLTRSEITYGETVGIYGRLSSRGEGLSGRSILLEYSTDGGLTWRDIGVTLTLEGGRYLYDWSPESGVYFVRARWAGEVGRYLRAESERQLLVVNNASVNLNCSLSQSTITLGETVEINASLQVATNEGNITIQYSVNGVDWFDLAKGSPVNGTFKYVWTPREPGEYKVRALWSGGRNYAPATSGVEALTVVKP